MADGGWHDFGGQGQFGGEESKGGWKPYHSESCESRFMMITVIHKTDDLSYNSNVVLDILVNELNLKSKVLSISKSCLIFILLLL